MNKIFRALRVLRVFVVVSRQEQNMNHDDHEDFENQADYQGEDIRDEGTSPDGPYRMRAQSPLSLEAERVMTETIGCAIAVHRALGPGFLESIYRKAMRVELEVNHLAYEAECPIKVSYRGIAIPGQRVDLIVEGLIVVELKAVVRLDEVHRAQVISYLRTTGRRGGLLINFRVALLSHGLRRVVL